MNILITGETGYIANYLYNYLKSQNSNYIINKRSIKDNFEDSMLTGVDVVVHLAGLVHKNEKNYVEKDYMNVNTKVTGKLAKMAKEAGVKHFIFFSTMAVFGKVKGEISDKTLINPISYYGKSKLIAEGILQTLHDESFNVAIVRPPMVYGPDCPGNYALLRNLSIKTKIFPFIENQRSMIFIGNLTEFIKQLIVHRATGTFHPQDPQYINTMDMVNEIAKVHNKKIYTTVIGASILKICIGKTNIYSKVFGDLYYEPSLSFYADNSYQRYNFQQAIAITEGKGT